MAHRPAAAIQRAIDEARLIAAQVDDHIGNLKNLMPASAWPCRGSATTPTPTTALLRRVKAELPPYVANLLLFTLDGTKSARHPTTGRFFAGDRDYFEQILGGQQRSPSARSSARAPARMGHRRSRGRSTMHGRLRAVLAVGTLLERFQEALKRPAAARQRRPGRRQERDRDRAQRRRPELDRPRSQRGRRGGTALRRPATSAKWCAGRTASSASPAPRRASRCHGWSRSACRPTPPLPLSCGGWAWV